MARDINSETERTAHIHKDVFALGLAIYPTDHLKQMCRTSIEEMQGMDYAPVPWSLAMSMFQTLEVYIRSKLSYLGSTTLIEFDRNQGVIKPTTFGETVMKKLADRVRANL